MTLSWHTILEFEPPLMGCVIRNRNYSFELLQAASEYVINLPTVEIAGQVMGCGNTSGANLDKFKRFGLTPRSAMPVGAPLTKECFANLECRVTDTRLVESFFVLEVVKA
jgi:flavin reductase (DIM6/NTAB) family NADH-FMN oxidoreductase RutF